MSHWYDKDGNPRHHEGKDGKDTTLREARKLGLYPSVTTIGQIIHKQGLVKWLQQEAAIQAYDFLTEQWWDHYFEICEDDSEKRIWANKMIAEAKEKTDKKADIGTEIHDMLEKFHDDPFSVEGDDQKICYAIMDCIKENTGLSLFDHFIPEKRFCNTELGYAGMCDLHTNLPIDADDWVLDYKTKDEITDKIRGWPEQAEQLSAYANGLKIGHARLGNIFISRKPPMFPGDPWPVKFYEHKDPMAWERFKHTLYLWQVTKKYGPYYNALGE